MKKSKWFDCQGKECFPKQKGTPSLVKIEHKNTATLDSARSEKNLKSQFCNYIQMYFFHAYSLDKSISKWLLGDMFHSYSSFDRKFSLSHHLRMCNVNSEVWHVCQVANLFFSESYYLLS